ncbi:hypothetical protein HZB00_03155 [Candidatus Woesearchaeota archaeon]|nr:hypothetical protein [Candidatus Woesearchaeota archaeon]
MQKEDYVVLVSDKDESSVEKIGRSINAMLGNIGLQLPVIADQFYRPEVRARAQRKLEENYRRFHGPNGFALSEQDLLQLGNGFVYLGDVAFYGESFKGRIEEFDQEYGALKDERESVYGTTALCLPDKNYRLVQPGKEPQLDDYVFALYIRFRMPE